MGQVDLYGLTPYSVEEFGGPLYQWSRQQQKNGSRCGILRFEINNQLDKQGASGRRSLGGCLNVWQHAQQTLSRQRMCSGQLPPCVVSGGAQQITTAPS